MMVMELPKIFLKFKLAVHKLPSFTASNLSSGHLHTPTDITHITVYIAEGHIPQM
jgi:hypothetical protein